MAILIFTFTLGCAACYMAGFFDPLSVRMQISAPQVLVYRDYTGPMNGARSAANNVRIYLKASKGIHSSRTFIQYLDDPRTNTGAPLHCRAGCSIDSLVMNLAPPYAAQSVPSREVLYAEFKYRSFFSYMTATMKFFPRLKKLLYERHRSATGPVLEMHDSDLRKVIFMVPVAP